MTTHSTSGIRFSVIVPTYNRPVQLAACLQALVHLDAPPNGYEVIVVNDGGSHPAVRDMEQHGSNPVTVLTQRNAGPAAARNTGAAAARGRFLAFTDDDCMPEPGWLLAFDAALTAMPDALISGRTVNVTRSSIYADTSQLLADFVAAYFDGGARGRFFTSNNIAVARDAFLDAGAFQLAFGRAAAEDREFCDRWSAQGRPSSVAPGAIVRHAHALSARSFARQHFAYGRGARTFRHTRAASGRPVKIDPGFYARSLAYPFTRGRDVRAPLIALLTAGAHAAYVAGLAWETVRPTRTGTAQRT